MKQLKLTITGDMTPEEEDAAINQFLPMSGFPHVAERTAIIAVMALKLALKNRRKII